jgi:hypothetical protein
VKEKFVKRLLDSQKSIVKKKKNSVKSSLIARIPLCEREIREKAP